MKQFKRKLYQQSCYIWAEFKSLSLLLSPRFYFSDKTKPLTVFALLFVVFQSFAQNDGYIASKMIQANKEIEILEKVVVGEFSKTPIVIAPVVIPEKDYIAENWITTRFNPYENTLLEYPFKLTFKDSVFASPILRKKVVTSHFGWRRGRAHKGIDIDLYTGDKVLAMMGGKVRYVKWHYGHGNIVVIRHYNGLETVYAHLSKQLVQVNDSVKKGQIIGKGGISGNARGSHLHLEVRFQGTCINPEYLFDFGPENKIRASEIWVNKKWSQAYTQNSRRQADIYICHTLEEAQTMATPEITYHIIKRGDTLSSISHKYQVSIPNLCKSNHITTKTMLRVGQKIAIH